jgi:hypothetical protein
MLNAQHQAALNVVTSGQRLPAGMQVLLLLAPLAVCLIACWCASLPAMVLGYAGYLFSLARMASSALEYK